MSRFGVHLIQLVDRRENKLNQREQRDMMRDAVREKAGRSLRHLGAGTAWPRLRGIPQAPMNVTPLSPTACGSMPHTQAFPALCECLGLLLPWDSPATKP